MYRFLILFPCLIFSQILYGQDFEKLDQTKVKPLSYSNVLEVPYITWGADSAEFLSNGLSLTTTSNSTNKKLGLNVKLVNGDNIEDQCVAYLQGRPMIRGTHRMLGLMNKYIGSDPNAKPVVFLQLSYSLGDHLVAKKEIQNLNDIKGHTFCLQKGGPGVGLVADVLKTANLTWSDIKVVWVADISGPNGAAERFKSDDSIDICHAITPDMIGLTRGYDQIGNGREGTILGAHVLVGTPAMNRSISDVWACRTDFYKKHRDVVEKFTASYLSSVKKIIDLRNNFEDSGKMSSEYKALLTFTQKTFNTDAGQNIMPSIEVDVHGLLLDCGFVGLPGQIRYFNDPGNLNGFNAKQMSGIDIAKQLKYSDKTNIYSKSDFDYKKIAQMAGIQYEEPKIQSKVQAESININIDEIGGDNNVLISFAINFQPEQTEFPYENYKAQFEQAINYLAQFGNSMLVVEGHSDTNLVLANTVRAGLELGIIKKSNQGGKSKYYLNGKELDLKRVTLIKVLIEAGAFDKSNSYNPRRTMDAALTLSQRRADNALKTLKKVISSMGVTLSTDNAKAVGYGVLNPLIAKPSSPEESLQNMRVEFKVIKVGAESIQQSDYDY